MYTLTYEIIHSCDEIAEILNKPKELIDKNLAIGISRLGKIHLQEKEKQENEDAYSEIRLQMHNHLIKKLRSLKEEWKLDNISQVTERIILLSLKMILIKYIPKKRERVNKGRVMAG